MRKSVICSTRALTLVLGGVMAALALSGVAFAQGGTAFVQNDAFGVGIEPDGSVKFEVLTDDTQAAKIEDTQSGPRRILHLKGAAGSPFTRYESAFRTWDFTGGNFFVINDPADAPIEFKIDADGNLTLTGDVFTDSCPAGCGPDYVFDPDYDLMSLADLRDYIEQNRHLPNIPSAAEMESDGINMTKLQLRLLEKVEELTLYALAQEERIEGLTEELETLRTELSAAQR